jgi:hypothetical protein
VIPFAFPDAKDIGPCYLLSSTSEFRAIGAASPIYPGRAVTLQLHVQPFSVTRSCRVMTTNTGDGLEVIDFTTTRNPSLPLLTYSPRPASLYPVPPYNLP